MPYRTVSLRTVGVPASAWSREWCRPSWTPPPARKSRERVMLSEETARVRFPSPLWARDSGVSSGVELRPRR